jgi:hypothetical protein
VAKATATAAAFQAEVDQLSKVEAALADEIDKIQGSLRTLTHSVYQCMADVITASDEYGLLVASHTETWGRLRSIKTALRTVTQGLHGYLDQRHAEEAFRSEPTEERVGYPVDQDLVGAWREALAQLADDSETDLPLYG